MDNRKAQFILDNLNKLAENFHLNAAFWERFESEKIFPKTYIDHMRDNSNGIDLKNLKKNLLIDITKRQSSSYEKLSKIFRDLYNFDLLDNWHKEYCINDNRIGSQTDVEKLRYTFERLNFKVFTRSNLTKAEMLDLMAKLNDDESLKNFDIFLLILMSHGRSTHILTVDGEYLDYEEIEQNFSHEKCPQLINKPKIIIFNCCRQAITDEIIKENNERKNSIKNDEVKDMIVKNFKISFTFQDYLSVRDEEQGTFFVNALVKSLDEYQDSSFDKILQRANHLLNEMTKHESNNVERRQVIEFIQRGVTKPIYFKTFQN
ncbi:caspase-like protein [Euroglyphus maynei]|uniref:Caspase-like protein n=1 Tax=Euroglyphus maynei TaxID=6958 RepID=A0A1Y3AUE4_EURMA|nr:caspase-like protein [Euroglyphus maynei]